METDTGNTPKQNTGNTGSPYVKKQTPRGPAALATSKIKNSSGLQFFAIYFYLVTQSSLFFCQP